MKTGDWLKLSAFALVGVVISLLILGLNSSSNGRRAMQQQATYGNYPMETQGYANGSYAPRGYAQAQGQQVAMRGDRPNSTQMQGGINPMIDGGMGGSNQQSYLPSQLVAMNYQLLSNDVYMQNEILAMQKHGVKLHAEVSELQTQYGQLRQGLNGVYAALNNQGPANNMQNAGGYYGGGMNSGNGMQTVNASMGNNNPMQNQYGQGGMSGINPMQNQYGQGGQGGMGGMNPMQNQYGQGGMGGMNPMQNQYGQGGMGGMNPMQNQYGQGGMGGMNPMQNQSGMGGMQNGGMGMDMGMMNNMMGMMNNMMGMMGGMQGSGSSSGSSSSGGMSSGGGMSMM